MKLDVVELRVKDWQKMLDFWKNQLGLSVVAREEDHNFVLLGGDNGAMIGLFEAIEANQQKFVPYFKVGDLEVMVADLKSKSIDIGEIQETHWGRQAKVVDPEGNEFYIYQEKRDF